MKTFDEQVDELTVGSKEFDIYAYTSGIDVSKKILRPVFDEMLLALKRMKQFVSPDSDTGQALRKAIQEYETLKL